MIVGGDEPGAAYAARDQVLEKGARPDAVIGNFGLGAGNRYTENTAAAIWPDPNGRQHGSVTHDTVLPGFLVAGIQEGIANLTGRSATKGFELVIAGRTPHDEQAGGPADPGR